MRKKEKKDKKLKKKFFINAVKLAVVVDMLSVSSVSIKHIRQSKNDIVIK